ncbi:MAG: hypothetical protein NTNFB02_23410 [Nitrospira sp.]
MLEIQREVQYDDGEQNVQPCRPTQLIQQPPISFGREHGQADRTSPEEEADGHRIKDNDLKVREPARPSWRGQPPSGSSPFPQGHQDEHPEERRQSDEHITVHERQVYFVSCDKSIAPYDSCGTIP